MALTGRGVAWLPQSLIADDLAQGRLVLAGAPSLDITIEICLFRAVHGLGRAAEHFPSVVTGLATSHHLLLGNWGEPGGKVVVTDGKPKKQS